MALGAFSVSLNVKDIHRSVAFYADLGFHPLAGKADDGWLILNNDGCVIGLFQGMLEQNIMTFNPGWDQSGQPVDDFVDIRRLQSDYRGKGMTIQNEVDETTTGPASFSVTDPDGNSILFDQHV